MAADDDDRGGESDPWKDLMGGDTDGESGGAGFQFEEVAEDPQADAGAFAEIVAPNDPAEASDTAAGSAADPDDAEVEDWLSEVSGEGGPGSGPLESGTGPLSVFAPDDGDAEAAGTDVIADAAGDAGLEDPAVVSIDSDMFAESEAESGVADGDAAGWPATDATAAESTDDAVAIGIPAVAAGAGAAAAPTKAARRPAKPARKASALGQIIGVVLGGLLALPIVAGILIGYVWMGGRDTMGLAKTPLAFLLPPKSKPAAAASTDVAGGSALDDLPAVAPVDEGVPAVEPEPQEPEPADLADADAMPEPEPPPVTDVVAVEPPGLDDLGATPAPAVPAALPPLDTAALDEAVGDAEALGRALGVVEDRENPAYTKLRRSWYRSLARVAEELVKVENAAATSGRPLDAAPDNVLALHGGIGGQRSLLAELNDLAPAWLASMKRGSDGVVLTATFESARRVGPYWAARVSIIGFDGEPRGLTVVSAREPVAIAGDPVIVTGVALEEAVIWAADVRAAAAAGVPAAGF